MEDILNQDYCLKDYKNQLQKKEIKYLKLKKDH